MKTALRVTLAIVVFCTLATGFGTSDIVAPVDPEQTPKTPGELVILGKDGKSAGACPLKHTDVDAQVSGFIARVAVVQQFHNPTSEKIEAVYTFPLPEDSAVDRMEMQVGSRTIVGEIHRREEAREIYEAAKEAGHVASLLDQERPNIFTQAVANIMPGEQVKITISYTQLLKYEAGTYQFNFPMVVGPRFIPGKVAVGASGTGTAPDTERVPDASRITPPITPEGTRAGHDISVRVEIQAGVPIYKSQCVTHDVDYDWPSKTSAIVTLKDQATIPNKDFVLTYDVAGEQVQSGLITTAPSGKGGFFALIMQPPKSPKPAMITPKEMIFVIDTSGSQMGEPLAKSKDTMMHCLKNVNRGDTFNMISFSNSVKTLFEKPQPFDQTNEAAALKYLTECEAGGGTHMLPAIQAALAGPYDPNHVRIVVFFTDGYIGNDFEVIDAIQKNEGKARVFSFGIGGSVNRFLIEKMAEEGRGASEIVLLNADSKAIAEKFYNRIRNPLLTDITVDWNGLPVSADEVYPKRAPDLFSSQPLVLKGCYTAPASGEIIVRGKLGGEPWSQRLAVNLPERQADNDSLVSIWARARVEDLMSKDWMGAQTGKPEPNTKEDIINVALKYNLMTQYTSFVAVERMTVTEGGKPRTIAVPVEMPEGVSYKGIFGEAQDRVTVASAEVALNCFASQAGSSGGYGGYAAARRAPATKPAALEAKVAGTTPLYKLGRGNAAAPGTLWPREVDNARPFNLDNSIIVKGDEDSFAVFEQIAPRKQATQQKLDKTLQELVAKYRKSGESGKYAIPGKLIVKKGKVEVVIWLKAGTKEKLAQIEKLGLTNRAWILPGKALIGWVPISKLVEIARLGFVSRLTAPSYAK